jgi:hypothetical protein
MTMASEKAPERIAERLPDVKLIFLLRNPIERAYSHYYYHLYTGKAVTPASFSEVIRDQDSAFRREIIQLGRYDQQIPRFDEHFGRDQMKTVLQEEFRSDPATIVNDVCRHVGVDSGFTPATDAYNTTRNPVSPGLYYWARRVWQPVRSVGESLFPSGVETLRDKARNVLTGRERPEMKPEIRRHLREVYDDTIAWTEERIGRELPHWR